ncbi:baseplate J/gp47 family protein [Fodinisporobacter ferrooxydans]|uniref:Baseplate J/gp47 family protein n=1 Tax=Fodinisporobacter ferrooxydans TaxID=2901836 RepID=A0ABY4CND6_9BACL|nr:baseplate J/gp47 family protein [Alicyclobacillaceae bacterium MYW30-H2]
MSFTMLTEAQIVANLIDTYSSLVTATDDINPGSVERSAFEAFAQELKRLYAYAGQSAAETQKLAVYSMFSFNLLPAQAAYTMVTLSATTAPTSDVTIPSGTTVGVPGTSIQYKTPAVMMWPSGSTSFSARVVCTQTGTVGNVRANTITQLVTPISGLQNVTVTNPKAVISGTNLETEDQRANRWQQWVNSLHRGDDRAILYGAKSTKLIDSYGFISEQVMKAQLVQGSGSNTVYIDNGTYDTSTDLLNQCQQVMNGYVDSNGVRQIGYKAAGIPTTAQIAPLQSVNISVKVSPDTGYTFAMIQQSVIDSITNLVQSLDVGDTLTMNDLNLAIGNTPGVLNFSITTPTADTVPAAGTLLQLGANQPSVTSM